MCLVSQTSKQNLKIFEGCFLFHKLKTPNVLRLEVHLPLHLMAGLNRSWQVMTEKIVTAKEPLAFSEALEVLKQSKVGILVGQGFVFPGPPTSQATGFALSSSVFHMEVS